MENKEEKLDEGFARIFAVELLFEQKPNISKKEILAELRKIYPKFAPLDKDEEKGLIAFIHHGFEVQYKDAKMAAQSLVAETDVPFDAAAHETELQQSWTFPEAEKTVKKCRHSVLVSDFLSSGVPYKQRVAVFRDLVYAVAKVTKPQAMLWKNSGQFVNPEKYIKEVDEKEDTAGFSSFVNVRFYRITNQGEGDMIMDTLGLGAMGLHDLQCHFRNIDRNEMTRVIGNTAYYLFDKGDVIESGNTIQGLTSADKWKCRHEESMLKPYRVVLDINPGVKNAAGTRK